MYPFPLENVDGAGKRGRDRRDKDRVATVLELFDDKCRDEGFLDLSQCRFPHIFATLARYLLGQTPDERVAGDSFEEGFLEPLAKLPSWPSPDGNANQDADHKHEEKRQGLLGWKPAPQQQGERPHQACNRSFP